MPSDLWQLPLRRRGLGACRTGCHERVTTGPVAYPAPLMLEIRIEIPRVFRRASPDRLRVRRLSGGLGGGRDVRGYAGDDTLMGGVGDDTLIGYAGRGGQ